MNLVSFSSPSHPIVAAGPPLFVVCLAQLMIVLDVTIVNVALPSIQHDLHFSQGEPHLGRQRVPRHVRQPAAARRPARRPRRAASVSSSAASIIFTVASLLCGIAPSQETLIGARFLQGIGAAAQASVILAIIVTEFPQASERARAMSAYVFVSVAGGSLGLLAGGLLTEALSWHWVFFVNHPDRRRHLRRSPSALIRSDGGLGLGHGVDWLGSLLVTTSLMSAIYAIIQATATAGSPRRCSASAALAALLMGAFLTPRGADREPDHAAADPAAARASSARAWSGASWSPGCTRRSSSARCTSSTSVTTARSQTGAAFLPGPSPSRCSRRGITARLVSALRFAPRSHRRAWRARSAACCCSAPSARTPRSSRPIFLACFAIGFGIGNAFMPLLTIAMADVPSRRCGPRLRDHQRLPADQRRARTRRCSAPLADEPHERAPDRRTTALTSSLIGGYQLAFLVGAAAIATGIALALALLRGGTGDAVDEGAPTTSTTPVPNTLELEQAA